MRSIRHVVCALVAAVPLVPPGAAAQDSTGRAPSQVSTSATVVRHVRPELALLTLRFAAEDTTPVMAGWDVAARADSLRRALETLGIPHDSLISNSQWYWWRGRVEVHPRSRCMRSADTRYTGCTTIYDTTYIVHDAIDVHVRDLTRVGAVIDTALAHHITDISGITFRAGDVTAEQNDALREATRQARAQAQAIAEASGSTLGRVIELTTQPSVRYSPYDVVVTSLSSDASAGGGGGTTVVQPSLPVSVTVYGKWELVAKKE